ncbi:signal peptidase II [Amycolatopsis anabasis]|uniref:signal peptidase II n=1 Tax=Amycolatopsis anabasis TaxID=1840409 RepID=UPI00131D5D7D|nr:signal peptidase II [Amycolatopsis anabasis]
MTETETPARGRGLLLVVLAVAAVLVVVDQLTKLWASSTLAGRPPVPVLGEFLQFRLVYNSGAAFSLGKNSTWLFTIFAAIAVVAIAWIARRVRSTGWAIGLGLLLGGAATHLGDRVFRAPGFARGHVVDFLDYNGWFVGNVADIALVGGAALLIVLSFLGIELTGRRPDPAQQDRSPGAP